jgi:hypothetical protein
MKRGAQTTTRMRRLSTSTRWSIAQGAQKTSPCKQAPRRASRRATRRRCQRAGRPCTSRGARSSPHQRMDGALPRRHLSMDAALFQPRLSTSCRALQARRRRADLRRHRRRHLRTPRRRADPGRRLIRPTQRSTRRESRKLQKHSKEGNGAKAPTRRTSRRPSTQANQPRPKAGTLRPLESLARGPPKARRGYANAVTRRAGCLQPARAPEGCRPRPTRKRR